MKQTEIKNAQLDLHSLLQFHDAVIPFFEKIWSEGEDNERRWLAESWSDDLKQKHAEQGRQSFSMSLILSKLKTILGVQKQARTSWKVEAMTRDDETKAILATLKLKHVEKMNKWKYLESEIFDAAIGVKFGATETYIDYANYFPEVRIKKIPYNNLIWDINARSSNVKDDALWMSKVEPMYRHAFEKEYKTENVIEKSAGSFKGREDISYYVTRNVEGNNDYDIIKVFTHFQKAVRTYYCVVFEDPQAIIGENIIIKDFDNKKEAQAYLMQLNIPYLMQNQDMIGTIERKERVMLDKYVFTYDTLIKYEQTDLEFFPFDVLFAMRYEERFISVMDFLKSPQIFIDRLWSQIDYSIGTDLKKIIEVDETALSEHNPPEKALKIMSKGGVLFKKGLGRRLIEITEGRGTAPQTFQIAGILQSYLEDMAGGRAFQGMSEGSAESGRAISLKQQAGMMFAINYLDNLSRFKQDLGENILWHYKKYGSMAETLKVQAGELTPEMLQLLEQNSIYAPSQINKKAGYITLNKPENELTFLKDAEFELLVTEVPLDETARQTRLSQMLEAEKVDPILVQSPAWRAAKLELLNVDTDIKQKVIEEVQMATQQMQATDRERMNMEKAKILSSMPESNNVRDNTTK